MYFLYSNVNLCQLYMIYKKYIILITEFQLVLLSTLTISASHSLYYDHRTQTEEIGNIHFTNISSKHRSCNTNGSVNPDCGENSVCDLNSNICICNIGCSSDHNGVCQRLKCQTDQDCLQHFMYTYCNDDKSCLYHPGYISNKNINQSVFADSPEGVKNFTLAIVSTVASLIFTLIVIIVLWRYFRRRRRRCAVKLIKSANTNLPLGSYPVQSFVQMAILSHDTTMTTTGFPIPPPPLITSNYYSGSYINSPAIHQENNYQQLRQTIAAPFLPLSPLSLPTTTTPPYYLNTVHQQQQQQHHRQSTSTTTAPTTLESEVINGNHMTVDNVTTSPNRFSPLSSSKLSLI